MYLENIFVENMGSISTCILKKKQLIKEDEIPRIVVLVGKNGTGKTTLISAIVDSFYQLAQGAFDDVLPKEGMGYKYFKVSSATNQRVNTEYGFSYIQYKESENNYEYIDKNGTLTFSECKEKTDNLLSCISKDWGDEDCKSWVNEGNYKGNTTIEKNDQFSKDFSQNTYCYFPSDRFEYPYWINEETAHQKEFFNDYKSFSGRLDKEILIRQSLDDIKNWILDIFLDSKVDIVLDEDDKLSVNIGIETIKIFQQSRDNLEVILSRIVERNVKFQLNYRNRNSRIVLVDKDTNEIILPSLDHLSAGQSTLLSIFANIIKSSEKFDLRKSISLADIKGIVLIDEIDLHLHISLQKDILPKLIQLFPKIQFIITSHSPFFLHGLSTIFDKDDYLIVNMPNGNILSNHDDFSEFNKAYEVFDDLTNQYKSEYEVLKREMDSIDKPLVITEGKTDWKHLKAALLKLQIESVYENLDIKFLEYENEISMGDKALDSMIQSMKKIPHKQKVIFIFDRDNNDMVQKYGVEEYSSQGNNIYTFCIPQVSEHMAKISIEFYYDINNIKQEDKDGRRLFIGDEFNKIGISDTHQTEIKNKCTKKVIIDEKVYTISDKNLEQSVALTKNSFAQNILNKEENFDNFSIENFKNIFTVIENILHNKQTDNLID